MSTECRCTNPDGGGTKCPSHHLAICIRELDGQCYGECIPIPSYFQIVNPHFFQWLEEEVNKAAREFVDIRTSLKGKFINDQPITNKDVSNGGGRLVYRLPGANKVYVWFRFEFDR